MSRECKRHPWHWESNRKKAPSTLQNATQGTLETTARAVDSGSDLDRFLYQPLAVEGGVSIDVASPDGAASWTGRRACVIVVVIFADIAAIASLTRGIIPDHHRTNVYACRKTHLYPSRLTCPFSVKYRKRRPFLSKKTQYHRADAGWKFPLSDIHNSHRVDVMENAKVRKYFDLPPRDVRTFVYIEDRLENSVSTWLRDIHQVREQLPRDNRVPIAHLCCLTEEEMLKTGPALKAWTDSPNFSVHLDFAHVECWQGNPTNVENSLIADMGCNIEYRSAICESSSTAVVGQILNLLTLVSYLEVVP